MRGLRWLVVVAIAVALALVSPTVAVAEPELVTVTDSSMEATWSTPEPGDTTVCVGRSVAALDCRRQEEGVTLHHARFEGLEPGRRYVYELRTSGAAQPAGSANPGSFTTLVPPPGRRVLDVALLNDVHIGEAARAPRSARRS